MVAISPERIAQIEARRDELSALMATGDLPGDRFVAVSKEYAELEPVAEAAGAVRRLRAEADSLAYMAQDGDEDDEDNDEDDVEEIIEDGAVDEIQLLSGIWTSTNKFPKSTKYLHFRSLIVVDIN